jgi:hypothetical protein
MTKRRIPGIHESPCSPRVNHMSRTTSKDCTKDGTPDVWPVSHLSGQCVDLRPQLVQNCPLFLAPFRFFTTLQLHLQKIFFPISAL